MSGGGTTNTPTMDTAPSPEPVIGTINPALRFSAETLLPILAKKVKINAPRCCLEYTDALMIIITLARERCNGHKVMDMVRLLLYECMRNVNNLHIQTVRTDFVVDVCLLELITSPLTDCDEMDVHVNRYANIHICIKHTAYLLIRQLNGGKYKNADTLAHATAVMNDVFKRVEQYACPNQRASTDYVQWEPIPHVTWTRSATDREVAYIETTAVKNTNREIMLHPLTTHIEEYACADRSYVIRVPSNVVYIGEGAFRNSKTILTNIQPPTPLPPTTKTPNQSLRYSERLRSLVPT